MDDDSVQMQMQITTTVIPTTSAIHRSFTFRVAFSSASMDAATA